MTMKEARELVDELAEKYDTNKDGKFSYPGNERVIICTCLITPKVKKGKQCERGVFMFQNLYKC